jgi:hypothetical protein
VGLDATGALTGPGGTELAHLSVRDPIAVLRERVIEMPAAEPGGDRADRPPPNPDVVMPPAPPGESPPAAVEHTRAVAEALTRLGEAADPARVAEFVKATWGLDLSAAEVAAIAEQVRAKATPPPDQPPPQAGD